MGLQVIIAFLCALGLLLLGWVTVGKLLLPVRRDAVTVWVLHGDERELERELRVWLLLRGAGLLCGRLLLLDTRAEVDETTVKFTENIEYIDYVNVLR